MYPVHSAASSTAVDQRAFATTVDTARVGMGPGTVGPSRGSSQDEEAGVEERFFKDRRYVDVCETGDVTLTFDLANGQQWKKRVWPRKEYLKRLLRRNSVEEILSYLISFDQHEDWVSNTVPQRPPSGSILFFDRSVTKNYRSDGYEWKTRRTMKTVREDRMKLRVGGCQLVYGCYAHSALDQNFHRRTYWLIQNPSLIMVHYLDSREFCRSQISRYQPSALDPHMIPTHWSMMTISDSNLCTLLDMTNHASTAKNLLSQLANVLSSSFKRSSTLEEILATNNAGLPVNMFEEYSRGKKKKPDAIPGNAGSSSSASATSREDFIEDILAGRNRNGVGGESSSVLTPVSSMASPLSQVFASSALPVSNSALPSSLSSSSSSPQVSSNVSPQSAIPSTVLISSVTQVSPAMQSPSVTQVSSASAHVSGAVLASSNTPGSSVTSATASSPAEVAKVLSQSPHIIMCCPHNGSVSYILTVPTLDGGKGSPVLSSGGQGGARIQGVGGGQGATVFRRIQPSQGVSIRPKIAPSNDRQGRNVLQPGVQRERSPSSDGQSSSTAQISTSPLSNRRGGSTLRPVIQADRSPSMDGLVRAGAQVDRSPMSSRVVGGEIEMAGSSTPPRQAPGKGRRSRKVSKGKEKATDDQSVDMDMLQCIQNAISGLLSPADMGAGQSPILTRGPLDSPGTMEATPSSMEAMQSSMEATPTSMEATPSYAVSSRDYDPDKFSKFADFLVKMDPIENLSSLPEDDFVVASRANRTSSLNSTESDPTIGVVGHTSSSRSSVAALSESQVTITTIAQGSSGHTSATPLEVAEISSLETSDALIPPEVPMSWFYSQDRSAPQNSERGLQNHRDGQNRSVDTASGEVSAANEQSTLMDIPGIDFSLGLDSNNWQQLLDTSLDSPTREFHSDLSDPGYSQINEFMDNMTAPDGTQISNPEDLPVSSSGIEGESQSIALNTTGGSSSWNGVWQNCDPGSIKNWLQSTFPFGEPTHAPNTGPSPPTDSRLFSHSSPAPPPSSSVAPQNTDLPQDLQDFIFDSHPTTATASIGSPSPSSSSHPSVLHDRSHFGDYFLDASSVSSRSPLADYASLNLDCLRPEVGEGRVGAVRKTSDVSVYSEPVFGMEHVDQNVASHGDQSSLDNQLHLSLPDLTNAESAFPSITVADADGSSSGFMNNGRDSFPCPVIPAGSSMLINTNVASSSPSPNCRGSMSPSLLPDIPEGAQMGTLNGDVRGVFGYGSSIPSSPSASLSSSSISMQEMFDDSPSVKELCEMLSESVNMQQADRMLTDSEQDQLFHAAETIQVAFRKYKTRNQLRNREKSAALLIEKYYKQYREAKEQKDQAARRIQHQYRIYRRRTRELKELSRAATFIQQMYRFHRTRRPSPYQRHGNHSD